jgi:serine/threonine protein kinase
MSKPSWIGATLNGRYRIEELLGQGGMSAVYKASDPNLKRVVAVKLIHAHLAGDPQFLTRFEEEAASVARLRHPNIIQVYDFAHDDDTYYMVLEFVPGETLNDRLKRLNSAGRQLPLAEALQAMAQVCDAVDYAHKRGLVHRDIKPANIMLDVSHQAILMDFGIVKIVGGDKHTATGAVLGTALYMSPEQIRGESAEARSDIYSLGVTLFEMLSGRPPFQADSVMTILMMHLTDPVPNLNDLRADVPSEVKAIIEKAMSKDLQARFQSAEELAQALRTALGHLETRQVAARPAPAQDDASTVLDTPGVTASPMPPLPRPTARPSSDSTIVDQSSSIPAKPSVYRAATGQAAPERDTGPMPVIQPTATSSAPASPAQSRPHRAVSGTSSSVSYPTGRSGAAQPPEMKKALPLILIAGGGIGLLAIVVVIIAIVLVNLGRGGEQTTTQSALALQASQTALSMAVLTQNPPATDTPTVQAQPTATPTLAATPTTAIELTPSPTSPPTQIPSPTVPPGILYVRINGITVDEQNRFVVDYETFEYTEVVPGIHVHFFFNTVPPDQAGVPGKGPWILYGGPAAFYRLRDQRSAPRCYPDVCPGGECQPLRAAWQRELF